VPVEPQTLDELLDWGFVEPAEDGTFRPSDIQRVRAVLAMRSPGIGLDQLVEAFRERLFTLQPMDLLYPEPDVATQTTTGRSGRGAGHDDPGADPRHHRRRLAGATA
jgi:hypothetical protein